MAVVPTILTFEQIKAEILARAKAISATCEDFHKAALAASIAELLSVGLKPLDTDFTLAEWVYASRTVDTNLLANCPTGELTEKGFFINGIYSIANPTTDVYILDGADVSLILNGNTSCKAYLMGNGQLNASITDSAFLEMRQRGNASALIACTSKGTLCAEVRGECTFILNASENTNSTVNLYGNSENLIYGSGEAFIRGDAYMNSRVTISQSGNSMVSINRRGSSQFNSPSDI